MIAFKPIGLIDKEIVQKYTLCSSRRNCDLSFVNLYSWRFLYQTEIAEMDGFLLFRFYTDGQLAYMMPVGEEGDIRPVIEMLMEDAKKQGASFRILGICANMCAELENAFSDCFNFVSNRDYADYIYLRSELSTLKGKKFQSKRNHLNKFRSNYPHYTYRPLTSDLVPACLELETQWCRANNCAENQALENERQSMTAALQHWEQLDVIGGVLYVEDEIVAFTFGAPINQTTFDTCVEKANTAVVGAYAMINYEFANHLPAQYIYINREEDLGLEGLRKAKLSYHPEVILEKYIAELKWV